MKSPVVVAFLLGLTSSIANAQSFQSNKPIICDETVKVIKALTETFNEKPIWTAKDLANDNPTNKLPLSPGPLVKAIALICDKLIAAVFRAVSKTGTMFF